MSIKTIVDAYPFDINRIPKFGVDFIVNLVRLSDSKPYNPIGVF